MGTAPPPFREPAFKTGDVLEGRYRIERVIGEGGMGTVYQAEHVLIKRRYAVKVLHKEFASDSDVIERFMNEARAAGTLGHPNIVESTDMGFARDELPYIVFEYLEGTALSDEVYRLRGLTLRRALKIAHQIASALEAAHAAGVVHRDLKSDNVFLTHRDEAADHVKVIDFGISRFVEAEQPSVGGGGRQRRAVTMGTPEFMAPEQLTAPETVDERTDIYALGVVLYEMLAGRTPFVNDSDDNEALLHKVLLDPPPALERKEIPPGLIEMIFEKLLAKDPAKRFSSMKDVKAALEAFWGVSRRDSQPVEPISVEEAQAAREAALPTPRASVPAEAVSLPPPPARKRSLLPLLVLAVLLAGAGAALHVKSQGRTAAVDPSASALLDNAASEVAASLDAAASEARASAQGIATSPMLRAAIETDSATLEDMERDGALQKPAGGQTIEIVQIGSGGKRTPLLRMPASATPVANKGDEPHAEVIDGQARIVAGAPVTKVNTSVVGGSVLVAAPVNLDAIAAKLKGHLIEAKLDGLGAPISLLPGNGAGQGDSRPVPVRGLKGPPITLVATLARVMPPDTYRMPALACFAGAGLVFIVFLVGTLVRGRTKGKS